MLSYDSLLSHAREKGMPVGKVRGVLREYIQVLALKSLYSSKAAEGLVFLGGTALRLGYSLPRFSEDLDFDVAGMSLAAWKRLLQETAHDLHRQGFKVEVSASEKGTLLGGDLRFLEVLQYYRTGSDPREKLRIKLEANRPGYELSAEPRVVSGFGEMVVARFAAPGLAFAEKILALLARELGRDIYDLFFMAGKRWVPDARVLSARGVNAAPADAVLARVRGFGQTRLVRMARNLEPFLFDPRQADLVAKADQLLPGTLDYLKR